MKKLYEYADFDWLTEMVLIGESGKYIFGCFSDALPYRWGRTLLLHWVHFASAMVLLGLSDGDNVTTGHGYQDIVDFILQNCTIHGQGVDFVPGIRYESSVE